MDFFHEKSFRTNPLFPHKDRTSPCRENEPQGTGEYPRVGWEGTAAALARHGHSLQVHATVLLPVSPGSQVLAPWVMPKAWEMQVCPC